MVIPAEKETTLGYDVIIPYIETLGNGDDIVRTILAFYETVNEPLKNDSVAESYIYPLANPYTARTQFVSALYTISQFEIFSREAK